MNYYKKKSIAGWFIFFNILTLTQGIVPAFDAVYRLLLLLIFAISFLYAYKVNSEYGESGFIKSLNLLILLFTIYGIINILNPIAATYIILPDYRPYAYLTNAYRPLIQIYPLYYFSRKGYINEDVIKSWVLPSFMVVLIAYYVNSMSLSLSAISSVEKTNNVGYLIASLFPLLYFVRMRLMKYTLLVVTIVFVFVSAKRGAILIAGLSVIWFLYFDMKKAKSFNKIWILLLSAFAGVLLFIFITKIFEESYYLNYLLEKTESGDSSGRDVLYSKAWDHFINNSSLFTILFGNGADSTFSIIGNRAHNDWLEILLNQGLLGVLIYAYFWIQILKVWRKTRHDVIIFAVYGAAIIVLLPRTLFSMMYNDLSPVVCMPFTWCLAAIDANRRMKAKKIIEVRKWKN